MICVISKVCLNLFLHLHMMRWEQMISKAPPATSSDIPRTSVADLLNGIHRCAAWPLRRHTQLIPEALSTSFPVMVQGPSAHQLSGSQSAFSQGPGEACLWAKITDSSCLTCFVSLGRIPALIGISHSEHVSNMIKSAPVIIRKTKVEKSHSLC